MMGKITDYKRTNYKDMIYAFVIGEQAAYLVQNILDEVQGRYIYVSTGVSTALCIGSAVYIHVIKFRTESLKVPRSKNTREDQKLGSN